MAFQLVSILETKIAFLETSFNFILRKFQISLMNPHAKFQVCRLMFQCMYVCMYVLKIRNWKYTLYLFIVLVLSSWNCTMTCVCSICNLITSRISYRRFINFHPSTINRKRKFNNSWSNQFNQIQMNVNSKNKNV